MLMCWNREYRLDRDLFGGSDVLRNGGSRVQVGDTLLMKDYARFAHFGFSLLTGFINKFVAAKRKKPTELSSEGFL